jgi:hypothetical protein
MGEWERSRHGDAVTRGRGLARGSMGAWAIGRRDGRSDAGNYAVIANRLVREAISARRDCLGRKTPRIIG